MFQKNSLIKVVAIVVTLCTLSACCNEKACDTINENATVASILTRYSIRSYTDEPVSSDDLNTLMGCAINAPSAMNKQPWEVRVVTKPAFLTGVSEIYKEKAEGNESMLKTVNEPGFKNIFKSAPAVVFIAVEKGASYGEYGCGLLSENIMVAANSMGLGTCCLGAPVRFMTSTPEVAPYLAELGFSDDYELLVAIAVGHPAKMGEPKPRDKKKVRFIR